MAMNPKCIMLFTEFSSSALLSIFLLLLPLRLVVCFTQELENGSVKLLIPTRNAINKCGFNTDRFVFNPSCDSPKDLQNFKFLGILFGVAMRTKKPLDLHLAQPMWKLLAGMNLSCDDLEEVGIRVIEEDEDV